MEHSAGRLQRGRIGDKNIGIGTISEKAKGVGP
jgi:hypothetical protein